MKKLSPAAYWFSMSSLVQEELCHIYALEDKCSRSSLSWVFNPIPLFEDPFFCSICFFSPSPSPLLYCLSSSFHTLIACISHRSPLANCIILMVFFMIILRGKLTFHAAY